MEFRGEMNMLNEICPDCGRESVEYIELIYRTQGNQNKYRCFECGKYFNNFRREK